MSTHFFLAGAIACLQTIAALFFLRFWRKTHDRFFALFSLSFGLMAVNRIALLILQDESEARTFVYVIRLFSYLLILLAIFEKNLIRPKAKAG